MARSERNNVDYFPHDVIHGKKMFYLRQKYQNNGYAVWYILLEELAKANYHYLDLKSPIQLMYLSSTMMVSEEILKEIINILVDFEEFDKELWEKESILYNQKFVDSIKDAYKKRQNNVLQKDQLVALLNHKGILKQAKSIPKQDKSILKVSNNTQSKVKKSKEENIYSDFYKKELLKIQDKEQRDSYEKFVKYLYGENEDNKPLDTVLKIENQLSFVEFQRIKEEYPGEKVAEKLLKMNNKKDYHKTVNNLNRTLRNWLEDRFIKK